MRAIRSKSKHLTVGISIAALIGTLSLSYYYLLPTLKKRDPDWLEKYCVVVVSSLPKPPFAYVKEGGPGGSGISTYLRDSVPQDKLKEAETCTIAYKFDRAEAYDSLNLTYAADIAVVHEFEGKVDLKYTMETIVDNKNWLAKLFKGKKMRWQEYRGVDSEDTGNPDYSYKGFPLVFKRENMRLGTVEIAEVFFGNDFYKKVTVYEK